MQLMPRKGRSGWFVEVPTDLKKEFQSLYRGRAAMRKLTVAAIRWAINERPNLQPRGTDGEMQRGDRSGEPLHTQGTEPAQHSTRTVPQERNIGRVELRN